MEVKIGEDLATRCPELVYGCLLCDVENSATSGELLDEIAQIENQIRGESSISDIKLLPAISATRAAYKKAGKDPNRYRPAAEQLRRRIVQGKSLYSINTLVDLVNLLSLETGVSIGGFDASKIQWPIVGGIGRMNEQYNGIGRGQLNVEGMPIIRDTLGGIGTPTSDEERTALHIETKFFFLLANSYLGKSNAIEVLDRAEHLLKKYAQAINIQRVIVE